jgi:hypothetical protein
MASSTKILNPEEYVKGEEKFVLKDMAERIVDDKFGLSSFNPTQYSMQKEKSRFSANNAKDQAEQMSNYGINDKPGQNSPMIEQKMAKYQNIASPFLKTSHSKNNAKSPIKSVRFSDYEAKERARSSDVSPISSPRRIDLDKLSEFNQQRRKSLMPSPGLLPIDGPKKENRINRNIESGVAHTRNLVPGNNKPDPTLSKPNHRKKLIHF